MGSGGKVINHTSNLQHLDALESALTARCIIEKRRLDDKEGWQKNDIWPGYACHPGLISSDHHTGFSV